MDIKAFSRVNLAQPTYVSKSNAGANEPKKQKTTAQKVAKALPYVAGAVVLAGLGFYAVSRRNKVSTVLEEMKTYVENAYQKSKKAGQTVEETVVNNLEKTAEKVAPKSETTIEKAIETAAPQVETAVEKVVPEVEKVIEETLPQAETAVSQTTVAVEKPINEVVEQAVEKVVENTEKPEVKEVVSETVQKAVETPKENLEAHVEKVVKKTKKQQLTETTKKIIDSLDLKNKEIVGKIERNRAEQQNDITRILNENMHDGKIDMPMMSKIAKDYIADVAGRGEDRFHQAADLLEQALIKNNIAGQTKRQKAGLHLYMAEAAKTPLYNIYTKMPIEESAARIKHLMENDLYADWYTHGPSLEEWYQTTMEILVKKYKMV